MTISRTDANRMNGAQSSGPVSEEGKARSSQNALKQGLFSKRRLLDDGDPEEFWGVQGLFVGLAPAGDRRRACFD